MDLELAGKVAIVTGGSQGIGKAVARQLAAESADVAIAARTEDVLRATAVELGKETGRRIFPVIVDTGDNSSVRSMVDAVVAEFGRVDVLVNSAAVPGGGGPTPALESITAEAFWADMNVKVLGYIRCTQAVAPHMKRQGWGRIVNIASTAASVGAPTSAAYCASKAGVVGLTRCVALEGAARGVTCNSISPGWVETSFGRDWMGHIAETAEGRARDAYIAETKASNPQKRLIQPQEIGSLALWLCRDEAQGVTMQDLTVSAGSLW